MTIENTLAVLGWSMVVNFAVLLFWALAMKLMPNFIYRTQSLVTAISREDFDRILYTMMGQFKIALLITHFGPYVALRIVFT
jgi:Na+-transporting methylmalonyl-CoA/oxaloacetate decarboxylase gamma subunit